MIKYVKNKQVQNKFFKDFDEKNIKKAFNFHKSLPSYKPTPLVNLKALAKKLGINQIYVKDESKRFSLNAFKVLGASLCIGKIISEKINVDIDELNYEKMISKDIAKKLGTLTFITATDGNHGRGIAWVANKLKQEAIVLMPKGSSLQRFENIKKLGAKVSIEELNYDDCVKKASKIAEEKGYILVQDTAWPGYSQIPLWIMQGYCTIMTEFFKQLKEANLKNPTHVFLQAGVGSFAAAVAAVLTNHYKENCPKIIICEPKAADCIYKSLKENDGKTHSVDGDLSTIMAGLACGEPSTLGFDILKQRADFAFSLADEISAHGIRVLSNPLQADRRIISGESGSIGLGLVSSLLLNKNKYEKIIKDLVLNEDSVVLCISTEGSTDLKSFEDIVWNGAFNN